MRLIDADKLAETIDHIILDPENILKFYRDVLNVINEQPTVNNWIPVSERLPESNNRYFTIIKRKFNGFEFYDITIFFDGVWGTQSGEEVIAWMPIPTYKENE